MIVVVFLFFFFLSLSSLPYPRTRALIPSDRNRSSGNNVRGFARGFSFSSCAKLIDTKSADQTSTLLHYVAEVLEENHPEVCSLRSALGPALAAGPPRVLPSGRVWKRGGASAETYGAASPSHTHTHVTRAHTHAHTHLPCAILHSCHWA